MKNIKRILNLLFIILVVLSTFGIYKTFAIVTDEMEATGIPEHFNENLTLQEYRNSYDIFCSMHGVPANDPNYGIIDYNGSEYKVSEQRKYTEGSRSFYGFKVGTKFVSSTNSFPSIKSKKGTEFTLRDVKYKLEKSEVATPEEAYILAEMEQNIYNKNLSRGTFSFEGTGQIKSILFNKDFCFEITQDGETLTIWKTTDGKYYKEVQTTGYFGTLKTEYELLSSNEALEDFYDDDWSLSSYVQKAWWLVDWVNQQAASTYKAPSGAKATKENQLSPEAKAFEAYIYSMANVTNASQLTYKEQSYTIKEIDDNGNEREKSGSVKAPELNYEVKWNKLEEKSVAVWDTETQNYKIGPFSIDYKDSMYTSKSGERQIMFSGISECTVTSNVGNLIKDTDENFVSGEYRFLHDSTGVIDTNYPLPNENFYLVVAYTEVEGKPLTEIQNISFKFKHMNAGAIFDYYEATGIKETWEVNSYCDRCHVKDPTASTCSICNKTVCSRCKSSCITCKTSTEDVLLCSVCNTIKNIYIERKSSEETKNIQAMSHGLKAARWYETTELNSNDKFDVNKPGEPNVPEVPDIPVSKFGQLRIVKNVVDGAGKPLVVEKDTVFEFNVKIERQINTGTENEKGETIYAPEIVNEIVAITVPAGESTGSVLLPTEYWEGDKVPKYTVTEKSQGQIEGYTFNKCELTNGSGKFQENTVIKETVVTAKNTYIKNGDTVEKKSCEFIVKKKSETYVDGPETFKFKIYIRHEDGTEVSKYVDVIIENGYEGESSFTYSWDAKKNEIAPTYRIEEYELPEGYKEVYISPDNGSVLDKDTITVTAYNTKEEIPENHKGELQIAKKAVDSQGNEIKGVEFEFEVTVDGKTETVKIKSGNSWSKEYTWTGDKVPNYSVNEKNIPEGYRLVGMKPNGSGKLVENKTVVVEVENKFEQSLIEKSIKIEKILKSEDKVSEEELAEVKDLFKFKTTIYYEDPNSYFEYNGKAYNSLDVFEEIQGQGSSEDIKIKHPQGNPPKFVVEEIDSPYYWHLTSSENTVGTLSGSITAKFINTEHIIRKYILTMEMGGFVWNDTNYSNGKPADSGANALKDEGEAGIGNVKVKIVKTTGEEVLTLYTDNNGKWSVPNILVPYDNGNKNARYNVEFTYDGQTYIATEAKKDHNCCNDVNKCLNNSKAAEDSSKRNLFNSKFSRVWGGNPITAEGKTTGYASGATLEYISKDIEYNGYSKKESELVTTDATGKALEQYEMIASTKEAGLTYPLDTKTALSSVEKYLDQAEGGKVIQYNYHAAYPYLNSINLGLVERPHADIAIEKTLEEAVVVINGKMYKYKYGEIANDQFAQHPELLYKQIQMDLRNINYTLNLYESDYYYRASIYDGSLAGDALNTFFTSKGVNVADQLELDIYLTYKLTLRNESSTSYTITVNQISDYADSNLTLVKNDIKKYIENKDGVSEEKIVAKATEKTGWEQISTITDTTPDRTSESIKYNRYVLKEAIKVGTEDVSTKLTFKVNKSTDTLGTGLDNCIILGDRNNIAEIDSYSIAEGRVDEDSAPGNINFGKNSTNWYEDDTDRAPTVKLSLYSIKRNVDGIAWEDAQNSPIEYEQVVGNGKYDAEEIKIPNMTTRFYEKVSVDGKEYDFLWPTATFMIGDKSFEEITGFKPDIKTDGEGKYLFTGIPAGDYIVQFTYGDANTLDVNNKDNGNIKYSGQDYKSTTYQVGSDNDSNKDGYLDNEWHNFATNNKEITSDARDDEARRLEVIAKSQDLIYENTSIMSTGSSSYGVDDSDDIITNNSLETYYMTASTAKLNMNIENTVAEDGVHVNELIANLRTKEGNPINVKLIEFNVNNIDFGVEARSETEVKLDKQIEQITLTASSGDVLLDAKYDIWYDYDDDGIEVKPNVVLDKLASKGIENLQVLNRTASDLGFRYLNVDKDVLQGATITIKYRITALNTGEVDRCSTILINRNLNEEVSPGKKYLDEYIEDLLNTKYYGKYLGQVYYQGATKEKDYEWKDAVVTTKVKQVIDYVDNDVVFSQIDNTAADESWTNITTSDLTSERLVDKAIVELVGGKETILDSNEVAYETETKNNLIVSVARESVDEDGDGNPDPLTNSLMTALSPYIYAKDIGEPYESKINVTVSRYYSSDMDIEEVENITETLKLYNDVGRRDLEAIQGNVNPTVGPLEILKNGESDTSVTELITLSPPTGAITTAMLALQIMAVVLTAITVLAVGIVIIKKKVLTK